MMHINLQFFGEKTDGDTGINNDTGNNVLGTDDNPDNNEGLDTEAFAELISDRDKKIEQLEKEMAVLKKSNADLLVKISAGSRTEATFEENLLNLVGYKPRKE